MKKLNNFFKKISLNPRKEITKNLLLYTILLVLTFILFFIYKKTIIFIIGFVLICFYTVGIYLYYYKIKKVNEEELIGDFVEYLTYFKIFIEIGNNVYNALIESNIYSSLKLKVLIEELILNLDNEKNIKPFLELSKNFNNTYVDQIILILFQLYEDNYNKENFNNFMLVFEKLKETREQIYKVNKENKISSFKNYALIGSGIFILGIIISIIYSLGDVLNGF